jgi:very-short-patch-repair endonuclease
LRFDTPVDLTHLWITLQRPLRIEQAGRMANLQISGPFSLADATAAGFSRGDVRSLLRRGDIREVVRGAYVSVDVPDSTGLRAAALSRVVPPRTVVTRRTAAWLYGVDVQALGAHLQVPPVEVLVPAGTAAVRRPGVLGYSGVVRDEDVAEIDGISVTTPLRTSLDLARWLPLIDGVPAVDAMLHHQLITVEALHAGTSRFRGYRHKLRLERAIDLADGRAESPQESRLRIRLVVYAKLPRPEVQYVVPVAAGHFRLDLAYVEVRVAVEYDGEEHHSGTADVAYDRWRRAILRQQGWTVHVARSPDVLGGWMGLTGRVRASLRAAGWSLAA